MRILRPALMLAFPIAGALIAHGAKVTPLMSKSLVTLTPGQTFYEGPDDIHTVGRA